jgi:hypothetical protein
VAPRPAVHRRQSCGAPRRQPSGTGPFRDQRAPSSLPCHASLTAPSSIRCADVPDSPPADRVHLA